MFWGGFFRVFFFDFFFLRTHTACCKYEAASCLIYLSTSTDCESCTNPISTNPGSMETGEYGLTCRTCFVARRLKVVAVAGLLWISWCVLSGADFFVFFFPDFFSFERTRPAASIRPPCLIYLYTSTGVRTDCHYLICLSCLSVYM